MNSDNAQLNESESTTLISEVGGGTSGWWNKFSNAIYHVEREHAFFVVYLAMR